ncbi:PhoU family transcriptional regulator [Aminobacter sp. DSM 101952]|uniref:phosphate signaling complex protein PhoU n=1 Tax=unclassified Aminobacter TaxID=2644704 RepID=UPI0006F74B8E|nr:MULTISPECIES: phosphate signaling complex protein PhoU [unclassified Aminobacter]KQU70157.1 PhoU family transcriptional regulator [Aminobacter sp. DSM 101952]
MGEHTVASFDQELALIDRLVREMGDLAAEMIEAAIAALLKHDNGLAQRVISDDVVMDVKQRDLDHRAITIIAIRQPMAQDLREVVGALRMASDLERIGDLAKNIAKRVSVVGANQIPQNLAHGIHSMSQLALVQVRRVVEKYIARDASELQALRADDKEIDIKYTAVFRELLTYMMEDPRNISACTHLLFCAKNLERIGDHVTNIAENAHYIITGKQLSPDRPKADQTVLATKAE